MIKGSVYKKESFLDNVAEKLNRKRITEKVDKPIWKHQPQWEVLKDATQDELVEVFKKQCEVILTDVIETPSTELSEQIHAVIEKYGAKSVITWKDERLFEYGLSDPLTKQWPKQGIDSHIWDPSRKKENIDAAEKADIGLTFSDITLAESGTVVLFSSAEKGRTVSLLPKNYIAIVPKSSIVPRLTQASAIIHQKVENGEHVASCVDFITGPSNSADIELNLVVGVHGPVKATYIIVNDK